MPRPIEGYFVIPFALAEAAATAYVQRQPDGMTFTDFFEANDLDNVAAFNRFCDPLQVVKEADDLHFADETAEETLEWLQVDYHLHDLMSSALRIDAVAVYRLSRIILRNEGIADPDVMPTVQASKRLGRQLGVTNSTAMLNTCMFGMAEYTQTDESILDYRRGAGRIGELVVKPEAYARYLRPHVGRTVGCPMISRAVRSQHTGQKVNLYDLYWEVAIAKQHADLKQHGMLDAF